MVGAELVAENLASLLSGIARGVCPLVFSTAFPFVRLSGLSRFSGSMNKQTRQRISPPSACLNSFTFYSRTRGLMECRCTPPVKEFFRANYLRSHPTAKRRI